MSTKFKPQPKMNKVLYMDLNKLQLRQSTVCITGTSENISTNDCQTLVSQQDTWNKKKLTFSRNNVYTVIKLRINLQ